MKLLKIFKSFKNDKPLSKQEIEKLKREQEKLEQEKTERLLDKQNYEELLYLYQQAGKIAQQDLKFNFNNETINDELIEITKNYKKRNIDIQKNIKTVNSLVKN